MREKKKEAQVKAQVKRAGRGSHGSTTKAGKVRNQTPKIERAEHKKSPCPRVNNRNKYFKRFFKNERYGKME